MSSKQGHESLESYTDNLKVKISEKYKPPPRINVAMTYAQRLTLNKQTQDNMPTYEYSLEKTVLEKMREWKNIRILASQERQSKLEKLRQEVSKKEQERVIKEQSEEVEVKTVNETVTVTNINNNFINTPTTVPFVGGTGTESYLNYSTNNSILMPTQASNNYSNILTPIPLLNYGNQQFNCKQVDKSPFNISDFENDTSSPFDNMELKSINDMEELAQVLNRNDKDHKINTSTYSVYPTVQSSGQTNISHPQSNYASYSGNQYSYNIPSSVAYTTPVASNYSYTNGYYYAPDMPPSQTFQTPYCFSKTNPVDYNYTSPFQGTLIQTKKSNCKSVPDIVNALEVELENSHLSTTVPDNSFMRSNIGSQEIRPKSTDASYSILKKKLEVDDPFSFLSKNEQDLCRSISSMGFPLSRVARVCKVLGNDQKKIVDHLLALSDLLDLGFPEKDVSSALIQCNNDRDKALDKLIL